MRVPIEGWDFYALQEENHQLEKIFLHLVVKPFARRVIFRITRLKTGLMGWADPLEAAIIVVRRLVLKTTQYDWIA